MKKHKDPENIKKSHVLKAAKYWDTHKSYKNFHDSTSYDAIIKGKHYPPKVICSRAHEEATGRSLETTDLAGAVDGRWLNRLRTLGFEIVDKRTLDKQESDFQKEVAKNLKKFRSGNHKTSAEPYPTSPPEKIKTEIYRFNRSARIVALRLYEANGICEECKNPAPFNRKRDGEPYLHVHHNIPLSKGGLDVIENTKAVCPNCHCKIHDEMAMDLFED
jgi:predicted HNH restriction endonuclease